MKHVFKFLAYPLFFVGGFYFAIMLSQVGRAPLPQGYPYIPLLKHIEFDTRYILPEDRWILNYHVFLVPLGNIDSERKYSLIILRPIGNVATSGINTFHSRFFITGLADKEEIAFSLQPDKILSNPNFEYLHLLEVKSGLLSKPETQLPESARLVSSKAIISKEP